MAFEECENLPAGQRKICRGESDLPRWKVNQYRRKWGLEPIRRSEQVQAGPTERRTVPASNPAARAKTPLETDWNQPTVCKHLGNVLEVRMCKRCSSRGELYEIRACEIHDKGCTERPRSINAKVCMHCEDFEPSERPPIPVFLEPSNVKWAYGITTVPERRDTLFPQTLQSLRQAGFANPRVFVDGGIDPKPYEEMGLQATMRHPKVMAFGNWILSLWELYVRDTKADRYAIFQDDVIFVRNLREYLDRQPFPEKGYWNLFSFMKANEALIEGKRHGWYPSDQYGRGALALIFNRDAVVQLLSAHCIAMKPQHASKGDRRIDGAVVTALAPTHKQPGGVFTEFIHNPSLVQHIGDKSSLGNHNQPKAATFPGEAFDALSLLSQQESVSHGS